MYSLAWNIGKPWVFQNIIMVLCMCIIVITASMKDAMREYPSCIPAARVVTTPNGDVEII
jgi:hypothetical protein